MLRALLRNTATSYVRTLARAGLGLLTFRALYQHLDVGEFGFYQLLWSLMGWTVLADLGLGLGLRRLAARASAGADPEAALELRRAIGAVLAVYAAGALLAGAAVAAAAAGWLGGPQAIAAAIFAAIMLGAFPLGAFREALAGRDRIHVFNLAEVAALLLQAGLVLWGCRAGWGLVPLVASAAVAAALPMAVCAVVAIADPLLRPPAAPPDLRPLRRMAPFSAASYGITVAGIAAGQSGALITGACLSLAAVGIYAPGARLAQYYQWFALQAQDAIGAPAARLHAGGDESALRRLLLGSQRWTGTVATAMALPLLADVPAALHLLIGDPDPDPAMVTTARLALCAAWLAASSGAALRTVLLMAGRHRAMLGLQLLEAVVFLAVTAAACLLWRAPWSAAAGALAAAVAVPALAAPWCACRAVAVPPWAFAREVVGRALLANAGAGAAAALWFTLRPVAHPALNLVAGCAVVGAAALPGWWLVAFDAAQRDRVLGWLRRRPVPA